MKFLRNEMDTAMKREKRAVQNSVDMDRAMGTGGVSKSKTSIRLRAYAECRNPRSRLFGLCRPRAAQHTSHAPTTQAARLKIYVFAPRLALLVDIYTHLLSLFSPTTSTAPVLCTQYFVK
jgi:hypothetical protein